MNATAYRLYDIMKLMWRDNVKINSRTLTELAVLYDPTFCYTERWIRRCLARLVEHGTIEHASRTRGYIPMRMRHFS